MFWSEKSFQGKAEGFFSLFHFFVNCLAINHLFFYLSDTGELLANFLHFLLVEFPSETKVLGFLELHRTNSRWMFILVTFFIMNSKKIIIFISDKNFISLHSLNLPGREYWVKMLIRVKSREKKSKVWKKALNAKREEGISKNLEF